MEAVKLSVKLPDRLQRRLKARKLQSSSKPSRPSLPVASSDNEESDKEKEEFASKPESSSSGARTQKDDGRLQWRPVQRSQIKSGLEDAAVLEFEEIDDVEVVYEEAAGGRKIAKLVVSNG